MKTLRFEIFNNCLYAANIGKGFDRAGVISISAQHLSSKSARADKIKIPDCRDEELVATIGRLQVQLYELNPNLLIADRNAEDETSGDYAGRFLLELIQNADDAMAPEGSKPAELIGAKGLGFKSVLEITETPEIFSGAFHFRFDREAPRKRLAHLDVASEAGVFRIPHEAEPDATVERLLKKGFTTVVKLPLRDSATRDHALAELNSLESHFLLLTQNLDRIEIIAGDIRRELVRSSASAGTGASAVDARLTERRNGKLESENRWRLWREAWPSPRDKEKHLSIALGIRVEGGKLVPTPSPLPLHVFFSTEEQLSANFLLHASFEVTQNRQRVRSGPNDATLLERLRLLVTRIAEEETPVEIVQTFRQLVIDAPRGKPKLLPRHLQYVIRNALAEAAFLPTVGRSSRRASPQTSRLGVPGFASLLNPVSKAVAEMQIVKPELEPVFQVLQQLDAKTLDASDYARMFRHVRCTSPADCIDAARVMLRTCLSGSYVSPTTLSALRDAAIWPIEGDTPRPLSASRPLLLSRPKAWPQWCEADALDRRFSGQLFPNGAIAKEWQKLVSDTLLSTPTQFLERCIAPTVAAWGEEAWSKHGWDALERVEQWASVGEWGKMSPYAPGANLGSCRDALVAVMRVPVKQQTWMRARTCYARSEIKGSAVFSRFFKGVPDRPLCGYPSEAKARFSPERWRALLRFLGVSWEPKILSYFADPDEVLDQPDFRAYQREIYQYDGVRYPKKDWYLEAFPSAVAEGIPAAVLMEMVASLQLIAADLRAEWFKVSGTERTHLPRPYTSFVQFQLRSEEFLPVKANIWGKRVAAGRDAFWPQSGIAGITPDLDLGGFNDPRRGVLRPALAAALKFQTKLPEHWAGWVAWNEQLVGAVERGEVPKGLSSARSFYEIMLDPKHGGQAEAKPAKLVCVDPTTSTGLKAVKRGEVSWIDRPAFAAPEVLEALSAAGLNFLPALLATAPHADLRLGVSRASEKVVVTPAFDDAPAAQLSIDRRLQARWRAIAVQCEAKKTKLPARPKIRTVHGLTLAISFADKHVTDISSLAYKLDDEWLIDVGNPWEALASALSDGVGHAADLRYRFTAVLQAPNAEAVARLLREDGIPAYKLAALRLENDEESDPEGTAEPSLPATEKAEAGGGDESEGNGAGGPPAGHTAIPPAPQPSPSPTGQFATGILRQRALYDSPSSNGSGGGSGGGGWANQQAAGMAGEVWLRQKIAADLPKDWTAALNERDAQLSESDIVVRSPEDEWHIEIKTLSSERFYWSMLEKEKAERLRDRYWMCFLVRQAYAWRIHWSWDPLRDLLDCERRLQWQWARECEGPRLVKRGWEPVSGTSSPMAAPDRSTIVVRILDQQLRAFPEDNDSLQAFWDKVRK